VLIRYDRKWLQTTLDVNRCGAVVVKIASAPGTDDAIATAGIIPTIVLIAVSKAARIFTIDTV